MRRVPFSEAEEGAYLILRNRGAKILSNLYGKDYCAIIENGLLLADIGIVETMMGMMLMSANGDKSKLTFDDMDYLTIENVCNKLLDGFSLSTNGRLYKEQISYLAEELQKKAGIAEEPPAPPPVPEATSEISSEEPSGQVSIPPNSTT